MGQSKILAGFLAGAAIGGVLAILIAPDKGENTRTLIRDSSEDLFNRFKANFNHTIDTITSALDSVVIEAEHEMESELPVALQDNVVATDGINKL